jgi:glycosyltransferase involved in cell wall biosynthesis
LAERDGQIDVLALIDHFAMGGAEMLLSQFALAAEAAGVRISVACLRSSDDDNPSSVPLHTAGRPPANLNVVGRPDLQALRMVRRHIASVQPQIVHTHLGTSDLLGSLAARSLDIPVVSTIHGTVWEGREVWLRRSVISRATARTIAVSEGARQAMLTQRLARPEQVIVIHNGITRSPSPGAGPTVRSELGIATEELLVVMVSSLRPEKRHELAIDAVMSLVDRFPTLRLVIAGDGPLSAQLAARAASTQGRVVMAGMRRDVMSFLDAADVLLHPSAHEAFPTALLEAFGAGVPVIATNVGGIPEIVTSPELGVLIAPSADSAELARVLGDLLCSPERRQAIANAGQLAFSQRFTARRWLNETRALYDDVLAEHGTSRVRAGSRSRHQARARSVP